MTTLADTEEREYIWIKSRQRAMIQFQKKFLTPKLNSLIHGMKMRMGYGDHRRYQIHHTKGHGNQRLLISRTCFVKEPIYTYVVTPKAWRKMYIEPSTQLYKNMYNCGGLKPGWCLDAWKAEPSWF